MQPFTICGSTISNRGFPVVVGFSSVAPIISSIIGSVIGIELILATSRLIGFDEIKADINFRYAV